MKDFTYLSTRLTLGLLSSALCACIVVPKKVSSYDTTCMITTHKFELSVEQAKIFDEVDCISHSCKAELIAAVATSTFATTASAIVSGSIALAGNTLYWLESKGKCIDSPQYRKDFPETQPKQEKIDEEYLIQEEIITAKS